MGLSASIPFLLQDKIQKMTAAAAAAAASAIPLAATAAVGASSSSAAAVAAEAARLSYNANAIFALCSWPFSLKLLWAPIVDAIFFKKFGRRKSWLIPSQALAGLIMILGASFVERQLGLQLSPTSATTAAATATATSMNVQGVTAFFFVLYFLMATQDIAVDGWALTMLSKANRSRGPICNSIGQNIGYFLSFVGFLALNDVESSETLWRPLFRLPSQPGVGLVSLKTFLKSMGYFMLITTTVVAIWKRELPPPTATTTKTTTATNKYQQTSHPVILARISSWKEKEKDELDDDHELDASEIGLKETYHRLWAVCQLPAVRWLFLILVTYRLPTALSDNVKFLKAVEYGMSKSTTALLSPTLILPLGILVPLVAAKIWHGHPLKQFITAYKIRVTLVPLLDWFLLHMVRRTQQQPSASSHHHPFSLRFCFWMALIASTAAQAICNALQFNSQMMFFASRVDPAIGGSYMTLLNTAANLGGTWPSSFVMWMLSRLTRNPGDCTSTQQNTGPCALGGSDPYWLVQLTLSALGLIWILCLGGKVGHIAALPDDAWRTHLLDSTAATATTNHRWSSMDVDADAELGGLLTTTNKDVESGNVDLTQWILSNTMTTNTTTTAASPLAMATSSMNSKRE